MKEKRDFGKEFDDYIEALNEEDKKENNQNEKNVYGKRNNKSRRQG